jgi:hypothetical protein
MSGRLVFKQFNQGCRILLKCFGCLGEQGDDAMTFDANGLYHNIGTTFQTPSGNSIQREDDIYRENAAIQTATQNFTNVVSDVTQRRLALRADIAATIQQLQNATTASEVQKLTGVLVGQEADLADTDKEIDQAASLTTVQDAENRNDEDKQAKARLEEQQAEFSEAITNYGAVFKPASEAPACRHPRTAFGVARQGQSLPIAQTVSSRSRRQC